VQAAKTGKLRQIGAMLRTRTSLSIWITVCVSISICSNKISMRCKKYQATVYT